MPVENNSCKYKHYPKGIIKSKFTYNKSLYTKKVISQIMRKHYFHKPLPVKHQYLPFLRVGKPLEEVDLGESRKDSCV